MSTENGTTRRRALQILGATLGAGAFAKALAPLASWAEGMNRDEFLQKHYRELNRDEMNRVLRRLEHDTERRYGREVTIRDIKPNEGEQFAYALNLSICIGCRRCM